MNFVINEIELLKFVGSY